MTPDSVPVRSLVRTRLVEAAIHGVGRPCVICGPAGIGKTHLAADVAAGGTFERTVWIDCGCSGRSEGVARLAELIADSVGSTLVVLDGLEPSLVAEALEVASSTPIGASTCQVLITSRCRVPERSGASVIDTHDLRFTTSEMLQLADAHGISISAADCDELMAASAGHAGVVVSTLKYWIVEGDFYRAACRSFAAAQTLRMSLGAQANTLALAFAALGQGRLRDVVEVVQTCTLRDLSVALELLPMIRCSRVSAAGTFRVHPAMLHMFSTDELCGTGEAVLQRALDGLLSGESCAQVVEVLGVLGHQLDVAHWISRAGRRMLDAGNARELVDLCASLERAAAVSSPEVMLLNARGLRDLGLTAEAQQKADLARRLAATYQNPELELGAIMLDARLLMDLGKFGRAIHVLKEAASNAAVTDGAQALIYGSMAGCLAMIGDREAANSAAAHAMSAAARGTLEPEAEVRVLMCSAAVDGGIAGRWDRVAALCRRVSERADLTPPIRAWTLANLAAALVETGRFQPAMGALEESRRIAPPEAGGLSHAVLADTEALIAACGTHPRPDSELASSEQVFRKLGDSADLMLHLLHRAAITRAEGSLALHLSERAYEMAGDVGQPGLEALASAEVAADFLHLGGASEAGAHALRASALAETHAGSYHLLRADMVLAEIDRRQGRVEDAVERIGVHRDYILTESSNWQIAMYARAFPGLLGVFAKAVGAAELPAHLLRMIPPESAEQILAHSRDMLSDEEWSELGRRLFGQDEFGAWLERDGKPLCRVRLFGGLDVSVGGRRLADSEWRKRKARLLFAMLSVRRGQDVTRDQLQEYLWPEMDETRSRNNLYVTWNSMKSVLMEGVTRGECPYVSNAGGRCRIVSENVRTDVEEFEASLAAARAAETGTALDQAISAYARAADIYRGDLLPGDVYDEWFAATRDHYRGEYCDAMRRLCELLVQTGDPGAGAAYARRGLAADSFREDLYQSALKAQIADGQRSAAVDTYFQCRSKLAEELGLDPSPETQALYEQVLGMEETRSGFSSADVRPE